MGPWESVQSRSLIGQFTRRRWFSRTATGFAGLAVGALLSEERAAAAGDPEGDATPPIRPRARAVIQLFQHGGPSHVDLLDPKPELNRRDGQPMPKSFTDLVKLSSHGNL